MTDTITIPLTKGYSTVIDEVDADLAECNWYASVRVVNVYAYRAAPMVNGIFLRPKTITLHRVICERVMGHPLVSSNLVDHINGNTLDNRRSNIRLVSARENAINSRLHTNNKSGQSGVSWDSRNRRWHAQINIDRKVVMLGSYIRMDEAIAARRNAELEHYGAYSPLISRGDQS